MSKLLGSDDKQERIVFEQMRIGGVETTKSAFHRYLKYVARNEAETVYNGFIELKECSGCLVDYTVGQQVGPTQIMLSIVVSDGCSYNVVVNQY